MKKVKKIGINLAQKLILSLGILFWLYLCWIWVFIGERGPECQKITAFSGTCMLGLLLLLMIITVIAAIPSFFLFFIFGLKGKSNQNKEKHPKKAKFYIAGFIVLIVLTIFYLFNKTPQPTTPVNTEKPNFSNSLCQRAEPYDMLPEFQRAYSLIIQRLHQHNDTEFQAQAKLYSDIRNCVEINYAQSENDLKGAEGLFYFFPGGNREKLKILVSPKYQVYDDLLTSVLLIHELNHALNYSIADYDAKIKKLTCYQDEAESYLQQLKFLFTLNQQERLSLTQRQTPETKQLFERIGQFIVTKPDGSQEINTMEYVTSQPYYQKQCEGK